MAKFLNSVSKKRGLLPGTIVHTGNKRNEEVKITVIDFDEKNLTEKVINDSTKYSVYLKKKTRTWINVSGVHNVKAIDEIGKCLGIHPLVLEDIVNVNQRPKIEEYDDYLFVVLRMLYQKENQKGVESEQVSIILGNNFLVTFQEKEENVFNTIRERIRNNKGTIRKMGNDYMMYSIIDTIVDNYFSVLERVGERIEVLEEDLLINPTNKIMHEIHHLKREIIFLRKSVWPLREVLNSLIRNESKLISKSTKTYLRDVYDHTIQVMDTVETYRDLLSGMIDLYLSTMSNKMNEIMKVLTIIATIFIPLTFITGWYGMNFEHMPELELWWTYPVVVSIMVLLGIGMFLYFRKKKWI